jgi:hypothetical protein
LSYQQAMELGARHEGQGHLGGLGSPLSQSTPRNHVLQNPPLQQQPKYAQNHQQPVTGLQPGSERLNGLGTQPSYSMPQNQTFTGQNTVRPPLEQPQREFLGWQQSSPQPVQPFSSKLATIVCDPR